MARLDGVREQRVQFLYDTDFVTVGVETSGSNYAVAEKNLFASSTIGDALRTNMPSAGFLAGDQTFLTFSVRHEIGFWGGTSAAGNGISGNAPGALETTAGVAIWTIHLSTFSFIVGSKSFFEGPISMTPAGGSPWGFVGADSNQPLITNGEPQSKAIYVLPLPIPVAQRESLRVTEKKPTSLQNGTAGATLDLVNLINDYTGARVFRCYLDGFNTRDVQ